MEQKLIANWRKCGFSFGCNEENLFVYLLNFFNSAFGQFRALFRFRTKQAFGFECLFSSSSHWAFVACQSRRCDNGKTKLF